MFEFGTCLRLLAETGRDDDEGTRLLLLGQQFHIVRAKPRCHHEDGQISRGQFTGIVKGLDALHFIFFGIHDAQGTLITATDEVTYDRAARLVYIVRTADNDDARRI